MPDATDVVIAGGSVAGCATAALLGRQGVRVTVLEKSPKPEHYKVVCSHFIQAGATPVLRRLGLAAAMERAGAVRNGLEVYTPTGGWYAMPDADHGYSLRREKLDPMIRALAASTPNVEVRRGVTVTELVRDAAGRPPAAPAGGARTAPGGPARRRPPPRGGGGAGGRPPRGGGAPRRGGPPACAAGRPPARTWRSTRRSSSAPTAGARRSRGSR